MRLHSAVELGVFYENEMISNLLEITPSKWLFLSTGNETFSAIFALHNHDAVPWKE